MENYVVGIAEANESGCTGEVLRSVLRQSTNLPSV